MRPIIKTTLCAAVAAAVAAPACAASSNYYLKLGDVRGVSAARSGAGKQLEIESWSWGATSTAKFGAVSGAHRDDTITAPGDAAAGRAAAKPVLSKVEGRQHGRVTVAKPLDRGALRVKVKFPWLECKVGAAFPDAVLQNDAGRYEFKDAIITGCAPDSVTLDYAKVQVRGWDPATK
ncbi:MAG TPA: hypothetical protein VKC17_12660 [Sphingomicrobium sp.]|nr:hypothetical protein [Sphingomicrobium sp.]